MLHRNNTQLQRIRAANPPFSLGHKRVFRRSKAIKNRHGVQADKAPVGRRIQNGPINYVGKGCGPIEHDQGFALLRAGLHDVGKGRNVGVKANAQILEVVHDDVHAVEVGRCGLTARTVERNQAQSRRGVPDGIHLFARRCRAPKSVLGSKHQAQIYAATQ